MRLRKMNSPAKASSLSAGRGRTRLTLSWQKLGDSFVVQIYNKNAHIGAVAVGDYEPNEKRVSTSVITRLGHKDDSIALKAAYAITKATGTPSCVIVGIHLDDITEDEIQAFLDISQSLVERFLALVS